MVEARALTDGVNLATQGGFNKILIEGNNQIVIQALKRNIKIPWQRSNIIEDIHDWLNQDIHFTVNRIFWMVNMVTD